MTSEIVRTYEELVTTLPTRPYDIWYGVWWMIDLCGIEFRDVGIVRILSVVEVKISKILFFKVKTKIFPGCNLGVVYIFSQRYSHSSKDSFRIVSIEPAEDC
jgi:hypothetical protein